MNVTRLLSGISGCPCSRDHDCPIDHVFIGKGAMSHLGEITEKYNSVLLVADSNTYPLCGDAVTQQLAGRLADTLVYETSGILVPDENAIEALSLRVTDAVDLIIGIGSGVINDLCKHVSYSKGLPYYIVATAPSMDGYASRGSALILGGMKVTLNADVPKAIIADVDVLASAPIEMIRSGYGDIIGKYSCLCDWKLSALVNGEYICDTVVEQTYLAVEQTVRLADKLCGRDPDAIGALMEALVAVGILMAYVGNSRPASGSEHHLSHYFEIVGILRGEDYLPHGIDVCYSAIETAKLRERLLSLDSLPEELPTYDREEYVRQINRIYGKISDEVIALQDKLGWYNVDRTAAYREKWNEIRELFRTAPGSERMIELANRVGLDYSEFTRYYGKEKIEDALLYAKDLKDRYSVLWLYYDTVGRM